ncbi:MAG: S-layer homology domain-containing protein [Ruminococcaceae bacterium]|nr:S-layer homology domain-containing protein [Oscillospiraceae bacterium]
MKKRVFAALLTLALALTLLPVPADALGAFADVADVTTARNVEVLRLMGVVIGDGDGRFRPNGKLTRAEFCKMTIELRGSGSEVVRYRSRTIFPDVRTSHWACGYINLATTPEGENKPGLMHGFPDGSFRPDQEISYGEAVTVLMRTLGWSDADSGGIWPQGYLDLGKANGLTKGLTLSGGAAITRAQAAQLFVNALSAKTKDGGTLRTLGSETVLLSVDLAKGTMRTSDGKDPKMVTPMLSNVLNGLKGRVVYNSNEEAISFLPSVTAGVIAGEAPQDAAVIVSADGSTAGFNELTGGAHNYLIFRNGSRVSANALKKNDVAIYSAANNAVLVCNTRVNVYYEDFMPSREAPLTITVLDGTELPVLPMAQQSIAGFLPGQEMTLLLTADGQVAGAVENGSNDTRANAVGYVDEKGKVIMFCGGSTITLNYSDSEHAGQVVRISQSRDPSLGGSAKKVYLIPEKSSLYGVVDVTAGTYSDRKLAENVLVLKDGEMTTLASLGVSRIAANEVIYARSNEQGEIDLLVLGMRESNLIYGRAKFELVGGEWEWKEGYGTKGPKIEGKTGYYTSGEPKTEENWNWVSPYGDYERKIDGVNGNYIAGYTVEVDCGPRGTKGKYRTTFAGNPDEARTGDFVELRSIIDTEDTQLYFAVKLDKITGVTKTSWMGTTSVTAGGKTYQISPYTPCWNADTESWFTSVEKAVSYGGKMNLYVKDGEVLIIEVTGR